MTTDTEIWTDNDIAVNVGPFTEVTSTPGRKLVGVLLNDGDAGFLLLSPDGARLLAMRLTLAAEEAAHA